MMFGVFLIRIDTLAINKMVLLIDKMVFLIDKMVFLIEKCRVGFPTGVFARAGLDPPLTGVRGS